MRCIKKLSSPPINLECRERVLNGLTHLKDKSDGAREQTARKLMGLL